MPRKWILLSSTTCLLFATYTNFALVKTVGPSMSPTIPAQGAWILVDRYLWRLRRLLFRPALKAGEVVVFKQKRGEREFSACKRVKAVSGGLIEGDDATAKRGHKESSIFIPPDHVWLQGDCVDQSRDSRYYGAVSLKLIWGRVFTVMTPWPRSLNRKP